jgi:GNAT superfamily N-acetyltransferase
MIELIKCNSENQNFNTLIAFLDEELNSRYGYLQAEYDKYNKIEAIETVVVAIDGENSVGCGCFKPFDAGSVEIKRMFVKTEYRGNGIAKMILSELESWASALGYKRAVLETGIKQHEAINFYTNVGYILIENFGQYIGNTNSVCMSKELTSR